MAKPSKDADRRALVEQMRKEQQSKERRRTLLVIGIVAIIGIGIIAVAAVPLLKQSKASAKDLSAIGVASSAAACQDVVKKTASGNNQHVPDGQTIPYTDAPPAFGPHYAQPEPMQRHFFTADDRPKVEVLVHNEEHGFTILWYDETLAADGTAMTDLKAIAKKFPATSGLDDKFLVVPWLKADGEAFPGGAHLALTHWTGGGGDAKKQQGVWQYCGKVSGEAVDTFIKNYPYSDAPEGNIPG